MLFSAVLILAQSVLGQRQGRAATSSVVDVWDRSVTSLYTGAGAAWCSDRLIGLGIQGIAEAIAQEGEGHHDGRNGEGWEQDQ